jgi:hypothetical protein
MDDGNSLILSILHYSIEAGGVELGMAVAECRRSPQSMREK